MLDHPGTHLFAVQQLLNAVDAEDRGLPQDVATQKQHLAGGRCRRRRAGGDSQLARQVRFHSLPLLGGGRRRNRKHGCEHSILLVFMI